MPGATKKTPAAKGHWYDPGPLYHDGGTADPEPVPGGLASRRFTVTYDKRTGWVRSHGVLACGAGTSLSDVGGWCILHPYGLFVGLGHAQFYGGAEIKRDGDQWTVYMHCDSLLTSYGISISDGLTWKERQVDLRDPYVSRGTEKATTSHLLLLQLKGIVVENTIHYTDDFLDLLHRMIANTVTPREYVAIIDRHMRSDMDRALERVLPEPAVRARVVDALAPMLLDIAVQGWRTEFFRRKMTPYKEWKVANKGKGLDAIDFVRAIYADHIRLGMNQRDLREWDPRGYMAFHNRCNYAGVDAGSILPSSHEDIDAVLRQHGGVPTYAESVGRAWREASGEVKRLARTYNAVHRREAQAKAKQRKGDAVKKGPSAT